MRIHEELKRQPADTLVWFLVPTVVLSSQQFATIEAQTPNVQMKLLNGEVVKNTWSTKNIWDSMLRNVRVVVAVYQILLDALLHGFVSLDKISLIVLDEVHNCRGNSAGAKLMCEHYRPRKNKGKPVPNILGLTASPMIQKPDDIRLLEILVDAKCLTPNIHREELARFTNCPQLQVCNFTQDSEFDTPSLKSLIHAISNIDIKDDPWLKQLKRQRGRRARKLIRSAFMKRSTDCQVLLKKIATDASNIQQELGLWAADLFLGKAIHHHTHSQHELMTIVGEEKFFVSEVLRRVELPAPTDLGSYAVGVPRPISNKVEMLIRLLQECDGETTAIVFVLERANTQILAELLSSTPGVKDKFRVGYMIGGSSGSSGSSRTLLSPAKNEKTLLNFHSGAVNLLVATSVLEEGIDIPACNLVVCFDKPRNIKSFIQRRGRARHQDSRLVLMASEPVDNDWEMMKEEMHRCYQQELDKTRKLLVDEQQEYNESLPPYIVESTGARLGFDEARPHLLHFCKKLCSSTKYTALEPLYFSRRERESTQCRDELLFKAYVKLPVAVAQNLRVTWSSRSWKTQRNAFMDAAFQAYVKLHKAGLVNDNLLPANTFDFEGKIDDRNPQEIVKPEFDPFAVLASAWTHDAELYGHQVVLRDGRTKLAMIEFTMVLPARMPFELSRKVYFRDTELILEVGLCTGRLSKETLQALDPKEQTLAILASLYAGRIQLPNETPVVQFASGSLLLARSQIGAQAFNPRIDNTLIRNHANLGFFYLGMTTIVPDHTQSQTGTDTNALPLVLCKRFPTKIGLKPSEAPHDKTALPKHFTTIPVTKCTMDAMPLVVGQFALCIPIVERCVQVALTASQLCSTLLESVGFHDVRLVASAITAPSAGEPTDYERLEFLGDSVLKVLTSVNCAADRKMSPLPHAWLLFSSIHVGKVVSNLIVSRVIGLDFPEGFLSAMKSHFVSNGHLCKATVQHGLDEFLISKALKLASYRPQFAEQILKAPPREAREISTKTLADIVEALLGAAYVEGGLEKSLKCIQTLIASKTTMSWKDLDTCRKVLFENAKSGTRLPATLNRLEELIGYEFEKKSIILEAMTHASDASNNSPASLDRLEFIGDAVLDYIVIKEIWNATTGPECTPLSVDMMHNILTASVNANILGLICMEWAIWEEETGVLEVHNDNPDGGKRTDVEPMVNAISGMADTATPQQEISTTKIKKPLWKFLHFASIDLAFVMQNMSTRHASMRQAILDALKDGSCYPWYLLHQLKVPKLYSDIVEAVIGAVWIDSGDLNVVRNVLERMGLLHLVRQMLANGLNPIHPKSMVGILAKQCKVRYEDVWIGTDGQETVLGGAYVDAKEESDDIDDIDDTNNEDQDEAYKALTSDRKDGNFGCRLFICGVCRVVVKGAATKKEARVHVADEAVRTWDAQWIVDNCKHSKMHDDCEPVVAVATGDDNYINDQGR